MKTVSTQRLGHTALMLLPGAMFIVQSAAAQFVVSDLRNPRVQIDYVIISPIEYVATVEPLAAFRKSHNGFSVAIITTEAIYNIFGQGIPPDSAIREFISYALTFWDDPKPEYFVLAGNVNTVPSHKEPGIVFINEDSIMVDGWFVEDTTGPYPQPAAVIGRLPAWTASALQTMISKSIWYDSTVDSVDIRIH